MDPQSFSPQQPNSGPDGDPAPVAADPLTAPQTPLAPGQSGTPPAPTGPLQPPVSQPVAPSPFAQSAAGAFAPGGANDPAAMPGQPAPGGQVFGMTGQPMVPGQPFSAGPAPKKRNKLKILLLVLLGVAILGGGSAAAYFGVVVPNKPENVLKAAVKNTLQQKNVTSKVTFDGKADSVAYKGTVTARSNQEKKALGLEASVTVTGFTFTGEARYVDGSAFVKVGDLSNITNLIGAANADYATLTKELNAKVTNQWFEIDSTLLKEANLDCALSSQITLSDADYQILADAYTKNPFISISNTSKDTVNGRAATKFQLVLDGNKADAYGPTFEKTSLFKKLNECFKASSASRANDGVDKDITNSIKSATGESEKVPFTLWVDKKTKTISRFVAQSTPEEEKSGASGKFDITFDYSPVTVDKPSGSKPITSLISEVMQMYQSQPVLGAKIERLVP
jgi:hypothetical protein